MRRLAGFTLAELIIAILIAALLVALVAAAALDAAAAARTFQCQNNLRQIGAAYDRYMTDSRGVWPPIYTTEVPQALFEQIRADTGLASAPASPAPNWGQPGPHWSIVLWPYVRSLGIYTCPADPKAGRRGAAVLQARGEHRVALLDAPAESYALNVILFRTSDDFRRQAGCAWGTRGDADYSGLQQCTTLAEQRLMFPHLPRLILFFCGASGQTVGSQLNIPFRTSGLVERWEWHPRPASAPFADDPATGSNYLFADGRVEHRQELPAPLEWGYEMPPAPPAPAEPPPASGAQGPSPAPPSPGPPSPEP